MARATVPATSWHVIETWGSGVLRHSHSYTVAPAAARVLREVTAPYRATHRVTRLRRQRATPVLSHVRLSLTPLAGGPEVTLAAMMIRGS